jgi:penicillin-binding protein
MNVEKIEEDKWIPADRGEFGPWGYAAITRVKLNNRHSPPLNMKTGMIDSDNIYFAYAALRTGEAAFERFMENAGYTESIPFEISVAAPQLKNEGSQWTPMLLAESSFGQGEVLVTPLQAAVMFSAFANGGSIEAPYLVNGLYRTEGTDYTAATEHEASVWKQNIVKPDTVNTIVPMLEDVISTGTGNWLNLDHIAGKTGTAQIGSDRSREINWFVGFRVGSDDPRLVLVMLEVPANEAAFSQTKFDIARALLRETEAAE